MARIFTVLIGATTSYWALKKPRATRYFYLAGVVRFPPPPRKCAMSRPREVSARLMPSNALPQILGAERNCAALNGKRRTSIACIPSSRPHGIAPVGLLGCLVDTNWVHTCTYQYLSFFCFLQDVNNLLFFFPIGRLAVTTTSLLVYPLHRWACSTSADQASNPSRLSSTRPNHTVAITIAAAAPSIAVWAIAVLCAGVYRWGVASGLSVGLLCAALTLKSVSFVQTCAPASETSTLPTAALGEADAGKSVADTSGNVTVSTSTESSPAGCETRKGVRDEEISCVGGGGDGGGGGASGGGSVGSGTATTAAASAASLGSVVNGSSRQRQGGGGGGGGGVASLTFEEFVFFLLLAPSLVCQPRYLEPSARRPRRVARAASEFFHAGLTYLTVHVTCSTFFAPALRVLAAAFHSSWAAADGWVALRAEGSGGWLHDMPPAAAAAAGGPADYSGEVLAGGQEGMGTVATAAFAGMVVLSPMMHFFMFYAFWHCVCLGSAELWGYPDRNTYGELRPRM